MDARKHTRGFGLIGAGLLLPLLLAACQGDSTTQFPNYVTGVDLRVIDSDPMYGAENIDAKKEVYVLMTEPIDPSSVASGVRVMQIAGTSQTDITSQVSISAVNNGSTLLVSHKTGWTTQVRYEIRLSAALRAVSGHSLVAQTTVLFFTGPAFGDGVGFISIPGAPRVTKFSPLVGYNGECFAAMVEFNEDLSQAPRASGELCALHSCGWFGGGTVPLYAAPMYGNYDRVWSLHFPDGGCSTQYDPQTGQQVYIFFIGGARVHVELNEAFDRQGEAMAGDPSEDFDFGSDYW